MFNQRGETEAIDVGTDARECTGAALTRAAKQYIEAHSAEKFSLQALSEALYVNGSYLLRVFKAQTGQTLLAYHNYVRCENAKALLRRDDVSISQAGEQAGFVSSSHFSHIFKKLTGMTPTEYRLENIEKQASDT